MKRKRYFLLNCALPLVLSLGIYLFFRPRNILVNKLLFQYLGQWSPGTNFKSFNWAVYNLPGALWLYSFLSYISTLNKRIYYTLIPLGFVLGIEVLQLFHITDGTFDILDVFFYLFTWLVLVVVHRHHRQIDQALFTNPKMSRRQKLAFVFFISIVLLSDVWGK